MTGANHSIPPASTHDERLARGSLHFPDAPFVDSVRSRYYDRLRIAAAVSPEAIIKNMTLEQKVGQLMIGFFEGATLDARLTAQLKSIHPGGVILYSVSGNVQDPHQVSALTGSLQNEMRKNGDLPLFVSIDQEGGRVTRLTKGVTVFPGNMALGATGSRYLAGETAAAMAHELRLLGINMNFAPVMDVNSNPANPVIGIRSFSSDPELAASLGTAMLEPYRREQVICVAKHFPGHGDTSVDSHLGLPIVWYEKSRLHEVELKPFYENRSSADMVMVAHVAFPALDEVKAVSQKDGQPVFLPATLSHKIITELLRQELGYDGVVITDALEMKAITEHFGPEEAVVRALQAGTDILLMPSDLHKAYEGVLEAVKTGAISEERIEQSVKRILRVKSRCVNQGNYSEAARLSKAQTVVGSREHKEKETKLATEAVTLLKNEGKVLPLSTQETHKLVLAAPRSEWVQVMEEALLHCLPTLRICLVRKH